MLRKIQQKALQLEPVDEIKSFNQFIKEMFRLCCVAYKVVRLTYECKILPFMAWRTSFGEQNLLLLVTSKRSVKSALVAISMIGLVLFGFSWPIAIWNLPENKQK